MATPVMFHHFRTHTDERKHSPIWIVFADRPGVARSITPSQLVCPHNCACYTAEKTNC
jgi:hypothetical protein